MISIKCEFCVTFFPSNTNSNLTLFLLGRLDSNVILLCLWEKISLSCHEIFFPSKFFLKNDDDTAILFHFFFLSLSIVNVKFLSWLSLPIVESERRRASSSKNDLSWKIAKKAHKNKRKNQDVFRLTSGFLNLNDTYSIPGL